MDFPWTVNEVETIEITTWGRHKENPTTIPKNGAAILGSARRADKMPKMQVSLIGYREKEDILYQMISDKVNRLRYSIETALKEKNAA